MSPVRAAVPHQRWTPEELEVLADTGKTAIEEALELKRTFNGVMAKSIEQGLSSKAPCPHGVASAGTLASWPLGWGDTRGPLQHSDVWTS